MSALDEILGMSAGAREALSARIARHLPPPLVAVFNPDVMGSHLLFDEFVHRLTLQVCAETGLAETASEWSTVDEIVERSGFDPAPARAAVDSIVRHLVSRGVLAREEAADGPRFRAARDLPALDPAVVRAEQQRHDPACLPSYVIAETAARDYPAFLGGKRSGEDILLAPTRLPLWVAYFSNGNVLYAVNNRVGAVAVEAWMPLKVGVILEIGGGCASGTTALLERLATVGRMGDVSRYRFTELVPAFLRRGQRNVEERFPGLAGLTFEALDMNRSFAEQGIAGASVSIVYAVNTLHVAHDLAFTLAEVRQALAPGGQLIISECVRPFPGQTLYPEFVFNLMATFRAPRLHPDYRPNGGFLTIGQWTSALEAAGFGDVRVLPDIASIRNDLPTFYAAALGATRGA
ncbi:MAG TPA: class I SAM-dependent methyltransferase [Candidatus Acidoferrum sp.]|nr:class I SAM-dependent methyltransferase [Candidatus Acidoferrum sp.]